MFGRNKPQTTEPVSNTNTNTKNCDHACYSGYREGDFLVCCCTNCDHIWTRRVSG